MSVGTVCQIGEHWFYFGGLTADEMTPEEYLQNVPMEDIVSEIYDTLLSLKDADEAGDWTEYLYYEAFLKEQFKEKSSGMSLHKAIEVLKMNRDLCMFNPDTGEREPMNTESVTKQPEIICGCIARQMNYHLKADTQTQLKQSHHILQKPAWKIWNQ